MRRCCLLLFVLALMGFAPAPLPRPHRQQPANELLGTWYREGDDRLEFTADRLTVHVRNGKAGTRAYALTTDPSAQPPAFDLRGIGDVAGRDFRGIYRRQGDSLTICYRLASEGGRPTDFEGQRGETVDELVRMK